ncbi:MAG: aor 7 [Dehalococcoidales bacterium]|nr:aor 7 [Dehalococcoidales bacterium]
MANGYNGKILRVNLTQGTTSIESLDETFCRRYLGGGGFIAYYLMKELEPGVEPLGPDNKLLFMAGPLSGLPFSGSGRNCIGAKSPLTGGYAKAEVGGFWGAEMRHAGFDGIIVEGKAKKPVYLWISNTEVQIKDGSHLWGKNTKETEETIRQELGDNRIRVASIGPGGENLVRFACVMVDLKDAAGRGGLGAVMGSKNLKAIAVRGRKVPEVADPNVLVEFRQWLTANPQLWQSLHDYGTGVGPMMMSMSLIGNIPIRNFRDGEFPNLSRITASAVKDTVRVGMDACYACVVACKKIVKIDEPDLKVDPAYGGPEYETLGAFGSTCGIDDLKAICKANELCSAYALDTISAGVAIAFAMECYENGLLTREDTNGIDLRFGNAEAMLKVLDLIARRQGIGDLLADGVKRAAERIGRGAERFAMHGKGLEIPMHDPRAKRALGLGYAVNPHGADHCANAHDTMFTAPNPGMDALHPLGILEPLPADDLSPRKVNLFYYAHSFRFLQDCGVVCLLVPSTIERFTALVKGVTGWDTGIVELLRIADRTLTLARMFNLREGLGAADDKLPDRFFQPHVGGPVANKHYDPQKLEKAKSYYYSLMGWDAKGVPTQETLEVLDIDWATRQ